MNHAVTSGCVDCDEDVAVPASIQTCTVFFVFVVLEYIAAVIEDGASYGCETLWLTCSAVREYSAERGACDSQERSGEVYWRKLPTEKFQTVCAWHESP